jgi:RNA-splicing ligase RtcB
MTANRARHRSARSRTGSRTFTPRWPPLTWTSGLAEEAPQAYKDVDVVETVTAAGIARKVARLKPLAVVKG